MGCICSSQLQSLLGQYKNLPLNLLAAAFPSPISISHMANISASLGAQATASAQLSAMAKLAASAKLSASLSASAVAKLEALAAIKMHLGINPIKVGAAAKLSLAIHSANLHLPSFKLSLSQLLAPILNQLNEIAAALGAMLAVRSQLGINLMANASVNLQAAFSARMSALASLQAKVSASAKISAAATAKLSLHARLVAAANILGINLALPGAFASLNAALTASTNIQLPQLNLGMGQMGSLASMLALLAAISAALGINLFGANTAGLLISAKASISAAVKAMAKLNLSAKATASLSARAQAQLTAKANLSTSLKAAAGLNFSGLNLVMPPFFASLTMLANLSAHLSFKSPVLMLTPCAVCSFAKI